MYMTPTAMVSNAATPTMSEPNLTGSSIIEGDHRRTGIEEAANIRVMIGRPRETERWLA